MRFLGGYQNELMIEGWPGLAKTAVSLGLGTCFLFPYLQEAFIQGVVND